MIKGKALMIQIAESSTGTYNTIAMATSCSVSMDTSTSDVTTKDDNDQYTYNDVSSQSWQMTTENLIPYDGAGVDYAELLSYITTGTTLYINFSYLEDSLGAETTTGTWTDVATEEIILSGTCILTSLQLQAPNAENASYSATFSGKGSLTVAS